MSKTLHAITYDPETGQVLSTINAPAESLANVPNLLVVPEGTTVDDPQDFEVDTDNLTLLPRARPITSKDVDSERDRRTLEGRTFTISGYGDIRVEGDEVTQMFIQARGTAAQLALLANQPQTFVWRDADNINHTLTAAQMAELYVQAASYVEEIRKASWTLKDMGTIPANFSDPVHWPPTT